MQVLLEILHRIAVLTRKELLAVLKDSASRIVLIVPPLLQSMLFGYAATYDLRHAPYALLDESGGQASTQLMAHFDATGIFERKATLSGSGQIADWIVDGKVLFVLHFGPDFESELAAGRPAPIQLILDGRNSTTAGLAAGQVGQLIAQFDAQRPGGQPPAIQLDARNWFNPNLESRWNVLPGLIAALSLLQTLMLAALSVAREREQGTFDQLLVTPLGPVEILVGKAIPPILIGLQQSGLVFLVARFWFDVPLAGSPLLLLAALTVFCVACVGIGLSMSALSANMQQAMIYSFVLMMPLMLLSGLVTPIHAMPEPLQWITYANPLRFGIDQVRRIYLEGAGLSAIAFDFVPMIVVSVVTMPLAAWLFRHRLS